MEPEKNTTAPEKKEFRGKLFVVETPPDKKDFPCEVMNVELPGGSKLPKLLMLTAVKESKFGTNMRTIEYLDYKKGFATGSADVPKDFSIKRLTGRQGHDMTEKLAKHRDIPDWEVMLRVINPDKSRPRPRRTSIQTIATVCGRSDALALAKEMEESGKVLGYRCPDVKCLIFYLKSMVGLPTMIDTRDPNVWKQVPQFLKDNPIPQIQGFARFKNGNWSGGSYGKGTFTPSSSAMDHPYEAEDYPYAREIIKALKSAGFTPGIEDKDGKIISLPAHDLNLPGNKKVDAPVSDLPPPIPVPVKTEAQETAEMMNAVKTIAKSKVKTTIKGMLGKAKKKITKVKAKKPNKKKSA